MNQAELEKAHKASYHNREMIERSTICGCFHCLNIFLANEVDHYRDWGDTAVCPHCAVDAVIGDASGYPIITKFLRSMNRFWFYALFDGQPKGFNENDVGKLVRKLEETAKELDPNCEVEPYIRSALHGESFAVVSRRLQVVIDFTPFDE